MKADIDKNGNLVIQGESSSNKEYDQYTTRVRERRYGRFQRIIGMPPNADLHKIKASFKDGVLDVTVPKSTESNKHAITIE